MTWSLAYICGQQQNQRDKKYRQIDDDIGDHADAAVRWEAHRSMKHNQGFTWSQMMLPLGECLQRIAAAAAMVDDFGQKQKHYQKTIIS